MSALENISGFSNEMNRMKQEMTEKIKALFHPAFKEYFDSHPDVKAVSWTQYTPYFNDGDPCEFGVHDKWISYRDDAADYSHYDEEDDKPVWYSVDELPSERQREYYQNNAETSEYCRERLKMLDDPNTKKIMKDLADLAPFDGIDETIYQTLGEGKVVVTRNGIDVEDYEHD